MVSAHSHKVSRVSWYSGYRLVPYRFAYGAFTLFRRSFQYLSATTWESIIRSEPRSARTSVWALSVSLAATSEITIVFFSSGYLDVSVHRVSPRYTMYSCNGDGALPPPGFPIRTSMDQCVLTAPHGFSQLTTSFFGSWCQGIHLVLLLA